MNIWEALTEAAQSTGLSLHAIEKGMGKGRSYITSNISRGSCPSTDNAIKIFRECGYSFCVVKDTEIPEGAIVIDTTMAETRLSEKAKKERLAKARERRRKALLAELERLDSE